MNDVRLPETVVESRRSVGDDDLDAPAYALVVAAGNDVVAGYESQRRLVGVDAAGRIEWTTLRLRGQAAGPLSVFEPAVRSSSRAAPRSVGGPSHVDRVTSVKARA